MKRILILTCAMATVLAAQTPPPEGEGRRGRGGRGMEALQTALGLDETQIQQLQEARRSSFEAQRPIMEEIRAKSEEMRTMVESTTPDPAVLGTLVIQINGLRQQIKDNHDATHQQLVNLVNGWGAGAKLADLQQAAELQRAAGQARALGLLEPPEEGRGNRGARGSGGPGGPRGPGKTFGRRGPGRF
ncbi:MAG: periplasmic heavy metal sensor [bacterium]|nr:periplasmic heavy metal sensor [bacterium]